MSKILFFTLIFLQISISYQILKKCDPQECNLEGECSFDEDDKKVCSCIGSKYFEGPKCSEPIDNCQNENPCQNGGSCKNVIGQFICENCNLGFGGHLCDLEVLNVFTNTILYFNHYGFYGENHKFLIIMEALGEISFSLEFVSDSYAIDSFGTERFKAQKWIYTENLPKIIKNLGIKYYQDLPYTKGYYHLASQTFWNLGLIQLTLRSYDTETAAKVFYNRQFELLIVNRKEACVPELNFIHGSNPLDPLMLNIASYNNFELILKKSCFKDSSTSFKWSIFSSTGREKLFDFGFTTELILKTPPYTLWFQYHGEVMSSYRIVARMIEEYKGVKRETEARCFIFVLPKPVSAVIRGGKYRNIDVKQNLILDASKSRDFALSPNAIQDFIYRWDCIAEEDATSRYCKENMGSTSTLKIKSGTLKVDQTYKFSLTIFSKVNTFVSDQTFQIVKLMPESQLQVDIECLRNCLRNEFVQGDLLHLKVVSMDSKFSEAATFKWMLEQEVLSENQNFAYRTKSEDSTLSLKVLVTDGFLTGSALKVYNANLPPLSGFCSIQPLEGRDFLTNFLIKCESFEDVDIPLSYEFLEENGFPLQRSNEATVKTKLPTLNEVFIKICDQFQACTSTKVSVKVGNIKELGNLKEFLAKGEGEGGLRSLLAKGDLLSAMILLKSVTNFVSNIKDLEIMTAEMESLDLKTLLQVEQFMDLTQNLLKNILPLTSEKSYVFNKFLRKLNQGFKRILEDKEIYYFKLESYEKSSQELLYIMQEFSRSWEVIPSVQTDHWPTILASDPLKEIYPELPDFDVNIAEHLRNWLESAKSLHECFVLLFKGAKELYRPWEHIFSLKEQNIHMFISSFDNKSQQELSIGKESGKLILDEACIKELREKSLDDEVLIQMASLDSNPFWWYPSEVDLSSHVFLFSAMSRKNTKYFGYLENPFEFQLKLKSGKSDIDVIKGFLKNELHMPLYSLELPPNALLIVTFLESQKPLKFLIQLNQAPASFKVLQTGHDIITSTMPQSFNFLNPLNTKSQAFLAVLLKTKTENVSFSFYNQIQQCLYWDFSLKEPQWSSRGCKPKISNSNTKNITCLCHHFSSFSSSMYQVPIKKDLIQTLLLKELQINWNLITFYFILFVFCFLMLILNFYHLKTHYEFLPSNNFPNKDILVLIYTGSHWNATTTANISLRFISEKGPYSFNIYQNPEKPFLKRNSLCKLLVSSQEVQIPLKLSLTNDLAGRYPSWYCQKIIIRNLQTKEQQIFLIDQWLSHQTLEIIFSGPSSFKHRFLENYSQIYINWYQFQPLWGCFHYDDLNLLERSCVCLSQLLCCILLVANYFGLTSMETYEEERVKFYKINFNVRELVFLLIICEIVNLVVRALFCYSFWLLKENEKAKNFKKLNTVNGQK